MSGVRGRVGQELVREGGGDCSKREEQYDSEVYRFVAGKNNWEERRKG